MPLDHSKSKGQAAVEFVTLAPLVFLIFFGIIQLAYTAFISFAVQEATFSIARSAAASNSPESYDPTLQIIYSLTPISKLNHSTLATLLATQCHIQTDGQTVHVVVKYPMPIWIPIIQKIFGKKLSIPASVWIPNEILLNQVFEIAGTTPPNLSLQIPTLPYVHWLTFSANALDENSINQNPN